MRSMSFLSALLFMFFLSISSGYGADRESANELYIKSGLEKQMQDIGPAILAGYKHNYSQAKHHTSRDKVIYKNIGRVVEGAFRPGIMRETVVNGLMKDIGEQDMKLILAWLDSPVGKKITELEERAGSREGMAETQEFIRNIKKVPLINERIRLIEELNYSMNITQTTVDIALATQFALSVTTRKQKKESSRDDISKLYRNFQKNRSRIEPMIEDQVHGSLLYTYQTLSDAQLGEYVAFTQSGRGRKYTTVTSSFVLQAIVESSLEFAAQISRVQ